MSNPFLIDDDYEEPDHPVIEHFVFCIRTGCDNVIEWNRLFCDDHRPDPWQPEEEPIWTRRNMPLGY